MGQPHFAIAHRKTKRHLVAVEGIKSQIEIAELVRRYVKEKERGIENMRAMMVAIGKLEEWKDNPLKRSAISDVDLMNSIKQVGVKQPLAIIARNGGYLVVDGNRRLRVAKQLGIKSVAANLYDDDDPVALAITLNTTGRGWDSQTIGQFVSKHPEALPLVPAKFAGKLENAMTLMGKDFDWFIQKYTMSAYDWGLQIASYVGRRQDKAFCKKAVLWVATNKLVLKVRFALTSGIKATQLERLVETNVPLVVKFEKGHQ